ncbi:trigger factor [bacterium]|jgi:trigger factor|nr:trigger factor [bacterium]
MATKKKIVKEERDFEIEQTELAGSKIRLEVKIPKSMVHGAFKSVQKEVLKFVKIPGFRRDKTPLALVKRQVGADQFHEYVRSQLLPRAYYDALKQVSLDPISEVKYENVEIGNDKFEFEALFSVAPEFSLGDYKSLKIEQVMADSASENDIDDFLNQLASKNSEKKEADEGAVIAAGDSVNLLVKGKVDGADCRFLRHYNIELVMGNEELYPDFDKNILGSKKLDRVNLEYSFAEDFDNKVVAGKTAQLEVKVLGHHKIEAQKFDDEFASKFGPFKTMVELKKSIGDELESKNKQAAQEKIKEKIQESLQAVIDCEVPEELTRELTDSKLEDLKYELSKKQTSFEDHLKAEGKSEDELKEEMNIDSVKALKLSFALADLAKQEGFDVEEREIAARVSMTAHYLRKPFQEILEYVESLGRRPLIRAEILQEKGLEFLVNHYSPEEAPKELENEG